MDPETLHIVVAGIAGFGGGAIAAGAGLVGSTPDPEKPFPPRPPWCHGWCPPLFGAILAVIIWLAADRTLLDAGNALLTASVVGLAIGAGGGALATGIGNLLAGQKR